MSGSWKIIEIPFPRTPRSSSSSISSRFSPRKEALPLITAFSARVSPRMVMFATLLPHPDSPTMPSVRPGWTSKEAPSTAFTTPSSVSNRTRRS